MVVARFFICIIVAAIFATPSSAAKWPYDRYHGRVSDSGVLKANKSRPEYNDEPNNDFVGWLSSVVENDANGRLIRMFINGSVPDDINHFNDLVRRFEIPDHVPPTKDHAKPGVQIPNAPWMEAVAVFDHLGFDLDPRCASDRGK